jgi:hypothetical protein
LEGGGLVQREETLLLVGSRVPLDKCRVHSHHVVLDPEVLLLPVFSALVVVHHLREIPDVLSLQILIDTQLHIEKSGYIGMGRVK